mgnify:CR=1 FL=1
MKTTKELDLKVLCAYRSEEIAEMISNGTIKGYIEEAAKTISNGDIEPIVKALKHNISSKITNTVKGIDSGLYNPHATEQLKVARLLKEYVNNLIGFKPNEKPQSKYSLEDIEAITDYSVAQKVYDSLASVKRDAKTWHGVDSNEYKDAAERFEAASKKRRALLEIKPQLTDEQLQAIKSLGIAKSKLDKLLGIIDQK